MAIIFLKFKICVDVKATSTQYFYQLKVEEELQEPVRDRSD